mmetsp:Transcript_44561/g.141889  ORF Transcript_44561/g.141889 Transcript_44561/m.141889 type:complete len:135 (+) Transcript_44561:747-1151(+)
MALVLVLEALKVNDSPRRNHGMQVLYAFCGDATAMERSRFFGPSKDIYQFDHFMGAVGQYIPGFIGLNDYTVVSKSPRADGRVEIVVDVDGRRGDNSGEWHFWMRPHDAGIYKGCWMVHRMLPAGSPWLTDPRT